MLKWIKQEPKTKCCGQIAVAVITGISLDEAKKLTKKRGCTTTKHLSKALQTLGFKCPDRCQKITSKTPPIPLAIGQMRTPTRKSGWHWVVMEGDKIYDGVHGNPDGTVNWKPDWKITSYLPIESP